MHSTECLSFLRSFTQWVIFHFLVSCENRRFFKYIGWLRALSCLSVCLLLAKSKIFQVYWSIDFVILSVCLFACLFIANRSQFQTDHHETLPSWRDSLNWEAHWFWGQRSKVILSTNFENRNFSSDWLEIWTRFAYCATRLRNQLFFSQKVKGQLKVKLLKSSISIWKIINFHLINLTLDEDCQFLS